MADPAICFVRLTEVESAEVLAMLNEPRNTRHLPLARGEVFTPQTAVEWVSAKDSQWESNGYGPWAILIDHEFAGWGGFQAEQDGADFGLVLLPRFWGHGEVVARLALTRGFDELGFEEVLIALPYSRNPDRVVARFGFAPDRDVTYDDIAFRQYRLTKAAWSARQAAQ